MKETEEESYLARFIKKLVAGPGGRSLKQLANDLTIAQSHLSHIMSSSRRSFNVETVAKMVEGVSDDPRIQGEFLKNYLLDQCIDKHRSLIHIQAIGDATNNESRNALREEPKPVDAVDQFCSHLRHLNIKEETLEVFRRLVDQAEKSEALFEALANLADLDIQPKTKSDHAKEVKYPAKRKRALDL